MNALAKLNARRSALRTMRLAYRKLLTKPTEERRRSFEDARQAARDAGTSVRERNEILIAEQARREVELELRAERKAGLAVDR